MRFALLFCFLCNSVLAQQPGDKKEDQAAAVHQWADEVAAKIEVTVGPNDQPATLVSQSLLRWSTAINNVIYGDCYIWTLDDRPVSFLSIYDVIGSRVNPRCLELQSLCPLSLSAKANDVTFWTPDNPGLQWADLDIAANQLPNAEAAQRRLRSVSTSFEGNICEVDDQQKLHQLRLMPQPIYKYESDSKTTAGAMFAFVDGTDPEILVLLEVPLKTDAKVRYALVRQSHRRLVVNRDGKKLLELPQIVPHPKVKDRTAIYFNLPYPEFLDETGLNIPTGK